MTDQLEEFSEVEKQSLIALIEILDPIETPNNNSYDFYPKNLEEASRYFRRFSLDLDAGFESLLSRGFLKKEDGKYSFAGDGKRYAEKVSSASTGAVFGV